MGEAQGWKPVPPVAVPAPTPAAKPAAGPEGDATGGVIPYKNPPALIAYYCGVFSLIPVLGFPLGVAGVILGIMGLQKRKQSPEVSGLAHALIGIIVGGAMMILWGALIALMIVAAVKAPAR